ncbi:MAG: prephenate dehydrogenase/arogenate dehydrogenase family protein [Verrucomicrobiaceae bacterium]|nr:MAG: prephenate dehydrogenase/arogenate dehydrogenase family protein [Verrucomicrobiaceae bacterium]
MSADFPNITILGGGLLGGSLAMALEESGQPVRLWARREETAQAARETGISGATSHLAEAVRAVDLLVLAVPVGSMPALVSQALEAGLPAGCLVTDVGSVKRAPHQEIPPLLAGRDINFIGSHPMAGSEQNGLAAASADLFQNAACLLTNDEVAPPEKAAALERFWQGVGCRTTWMSAAAHDELVARISHLPHVVAAGAALVCLQNPADGRFGGGGLRDTTRVAGGNAGMWAEILTENRQALLDPLRETIASLSEILAHLESGDQQAARQWLAAAKQQRDTLNTIC